MDSCPENKTLTSEVSLLCPSCGTPMTAEQKFFPRCGASIMSANRASASSPSCSACGTTLAPGTSYCPACGVLNSSSTSATDCYNSDTPSINRFTPAADPPGKSKKVPIIIGAVSLVVVVIATIIIMSVMSAKRAEENRDNYISDATRFLDTTMDAGINLEDIVDTIQEYWYDNIWYDLHGYDIDAAIAEALDDKSAELSQAKSDKKKVDELYSKLKNIPEEIPEEDRDRLKKIHVAVIGLYNFYEAYYEMAIEPSGSYNTYSASNSSTTDGFIDAYDELSELLK